MNELNEWKEESQGKRLDLWIPRQIFLYSFYTISTTTGYCEVIRDNRLDKFQGYKQKVLNQECKVFHLT
jgi:hypothetical protein